MKQMTCAQMGGPCNAMIKGNSAEEIAKNGGKHLKQAHPDIAAQMEKMSPDENAKWMADFKTKFDAAPAM